MANAQLQQHEYDGYLFVLSERSTAAPSPSTAAPNSEFDLDSGAAPLLEWVERFCILETDRSTGRGAFQILEDYTADAPLEVVAVDERCKVALVLSNASGQVCVEVQGQHFPEEPALLVRCSSMPVLRQWFAKLQAIIAQCSAYNEAPAGDWGKKGNATASASAAGAAAGARSQANAPTSLSPTSRAGRGGLENGSRQGGNEATAGESASGSSNSSDDLDELQVVEGRQRRRMRRRQQGHPRRLPGRYSRGQVVQGFVRNRTVRQADQRDEDDDIDDDDCFDSGSSFYSDSNSFHKRVPRSRHLQRRQRQRKNREHRRHRGSNRQRRKHRHPSQSASWSSDDAESDGSARNSFQPRYLPVAGPKQNLAPHAPAAWRAVPADRAYGHVQPNNAEMYHDLAHGGQTHVAPREFAATSPNMYENAGAAGRVWSAEHPGVGLSPLATSPGNGRIVPFAAATHRVAFDFQAAGPEEMSCQRGDLVQVSIVASWSRLISVTSDPLRLPHDEVSISM